MSSTTTGISKTPWVEVGEGGLCLRELGRGFEGKSEGRGREKKPGGDGRGGRNMGNPPCLLS